MPVTVRARKAFVAIVACLTLLAGCTSGGSGSGSKSHPHALDPATAKLAQQAALQPCPTAGKPAAGAKVLPDLTLQCLGGTGSVPLRKLTGTPTVLNFWATWCTDCRAEMSALQQFATAAAGKVRVVGVNSQDLSQKAPLSFLADNKIHFASVYDKQGSAGRALGLPGLPVTVLIRADGSIVQVHPAGVTFAALRQLVRQQLHVDIRG
ncbi:MAG TPA: TlpA disulfide reductase family protein [Mycobacteriales bacterium]|nr:TlpA disulfide reductase family protein [Mycobacteriales bacterium]